MIPLSNRHRSICVSILIRMLGVNKRTNKENEDDRNTLLQNRIQNDGSQT
jgi:hypothetical protein